METVNEIEEEPSARRERAAEWSRRERASPHDAVCVPLRCVPCSRARQQVRRATGWVCSACSTGPGPVDLVLQHYYHGASGWDTARFDAAILSVQYGPAGDVIAAGGEDGLHLRTNRSDFFVLEGPTGDCILRLARSAGERRSCTRRLQISYSIKTVAARTTRIAPANFTVLGNCPTLHVLCKDTGTHCVCMHRCGSLRPLPSPPPISGGEAWTTGITSRFTYAVGGVGPVRGLRGGGRGGWCEEWARSG